MEVRAAAIPEVKFIKPVRYSDHRGFFSETYSKKALEEAGISLDFVQDNHSLSVQMGVIRGIHFQIPPFAQDKLLRVVRGSVFDVAVDLRRSSPTFGKHVSVVLSAEEWNQILVPAGFGHGFCTLEPNTEVIYKVTSYYAPDCDRGVLWNDPQLGIQWPVSEREAILSGKDLGLPPFSEVADFFS
ncbi:MAG TPA: dTDP-4-dehydrorhamnose 3,5-epimerase [Terriglobia bacterium]|nr:dTDP-4-dehydrorhamnose 3,5-epimerase [Terriglobia bacterium]